MPMSASEATRLAVGPISVPPATCDYSGELVVLGRVKVGRARESRRVVHVFALPSQAQRGITLRARCGERLPADDVQWLSGISGMPCELCVLRSMPGDR